MKTDGRYAVCLHCSRISTVEEWEAGSDYYGKIYKCPGSRCDGGELDMMVSDTVGDALDSAQCYGGTVEMSDRARKLAIEDGDAGLIT